VTLTLDRPLAGVTLPPHAIAEAQQLHLQTSEMAADLPPLLDFVRTTGCHVNDLAVQSPSLQSVFLKLTGRELRE